MSPEDIENWDGLNEHEQMIARTYIRNLYHRRLDHCCKVPPAGWQCSREPGHPGPCAARPIPPPKLYDEPAD